MNKKILLSFLLVIVLTSLFSGFVLADLEPSFPVATESSSGSCDISATECTSVTDQEQVVITLFYSETCPHCHALIAYLDELSNERDDFVLEKYEVVQDKEARDYALKVTKQHDVPFKSVPTYFIGDKYFVGYSENMNEDILAAIDAVHAGLKIEDTNKINIPIFGTLDASSVSLPVLAIVLGFIDGFNPCAFFVLFFLLSMLVYAKSRKRMALIGGIFVFFSGLIYFIFMSAWLNFFLVTQNIVYITLIAGLVALVIAFINIKDFFAFKKGVSLSISDKNRKSLMKKMRGLLKAESLFSMILGTIILAVSANLYELLCTAGFPMVFTKALTLQALPKATYYLYLLLYNVVYVVPLIVIVTVFTVTLGAKKLSQKQGEFLKLVSGMMMLALGGMLVFNPGMLNNIVASIGLIVGALLLTFVVVFLKKKIVKHKAKKEQKTGERKPKK